MPSHCDDWNDAQEWETVVIRKAVQRFDSAFIAEVRSRRLAMRLDYASFGALVKTTAYTMRNFEEGRLEFDTALQHRLRGLLLSPLPH